MNVRFIINNSELNIDVNPASSTLKLIREELGLSSVKTGCGEGECGACTVIIGEIKNGNLEYKNVASCLLPVGELNGKHLVTVEGINGIGLSPIQQAFVDEGAVQCGFCTPGFIMSITGFLLSSKEITKKSIVDSIDGNICRCTGYYSIKRAVDRIISGIDGKTGSENRISFLIEHSFIPDYFNSITDRLNIIQRENPKFDEEKISSEKTIMIGGGTDLLLGEPEFKDSDVKFISEIDGISDIYSKDNYIYIGAGATVEEIKNSELLNNYFPWLSEYMYLVSSQIIRNSATVGGNLVNASPIGDLSVLFLALNPVLEIGFDDNVREVYLKDFFKGYKDVDLDKDELVLRIKISTDTVGGIFNFEKVSRRKYLDIASCNTAACFYLDGRKIKKCDLSAGGVSPIPLYLKKSSSFLTGKDINSETLDEVLKIATDEIYPIDDVRGSATYKRELLKRLIRAHFNKLELMLNGGGLNEQ